MTDQPNDPNPFRTPRLIVENESDDTSVDSQTDSTFTIADWCFLCALVVSAAVSVGILIGGIVMALNSS